MERVWVRAPRPMMLRRVLSVALVALLLAAPFASASGSYPPEDAPRTQVGPTTLAHWVGEPPSALLGQPGATMEATRGENATLHFGLDKPNATSENASNGSIAYFVAFVNVTSDDLGLNESLLIRTDARLSLVWDFNATEFVVPESAPNDAKYRLTVELYEERDGNATLLGNATDEGTLTILSAEIPVPPTGLPAWALPLGLLLLLGVLVFGGLTAKRRADRRRMNAAPRRSQVMRDMELERKLERAQQKDPEQAHVIKQELRAQEQVREKRREVQILEAKRADALKTIDLLKKRHEAGGLTKLQYDNMVAKKQIDLQRIEAEIAQMEAEDAGSSAAA